MARCVPNQSDSLARTYLLEMQRLGTRCCNPARGMCASGRDGRWPPRENCWRKSFDIVRIVGCDRAHRAEAGKTAPGTPLARRAVNPGRPWRRVAEEPHAGSDPTPEKPPRAPSLVIRVSGGKSHAFGILQRSHTILLEKLCSPGPVMVVASSGQEETAVQRRKTFCGTVESARCDSRPGSWLAGYGKPTWPF
jgi:hypothetical protein